jgi:hypothetical protein
LPFEGFAFFSSLFFLPAFRVVPSGTELDIVAILTHRLDKIHLAQRHNNGH